MNKWLEYTKKMRCYLLCINISCLVDCSQFTADWEQTPDTASLSKAVTNLKTGDVCQPRWVTVERSRGSYPHLSLTRLAFLHFLQTWLIITRQTCWKFLIRNKYKFGFGLNLHLKNAAMPAIQWNTPMHTAVSVSVPIFIFRLKAIIAIIALLFTIFKIQ